MSPEPFSRELGPQEALFIEMNRLSRGGLQFVSFIKVCEPLQMESLREGLTYLHKRHPFLRARVKRGERLRWVCDVDFVDVPIEVTSIFDQLDLEKEFRELAETFIETEEHVYRLRVYTNKQGLVDWICFINIHAILDGRSLMTLFSDLDKFLCLHEKPRHEVKSLPLLNSIASQLEASGYCGEKKFEHQIEGGSRWAVEKKASVADRRACAKSYLVSPKKIERLASLAKKNQIKLTALYCAVASVAARVMPACGNLPEVIFTMDARLLCNPIIPSDHVGSFSETASLKLPPNATSSDIFEVAKLLNNEINLVLLKQKPMTKSLRSDYSIEEVTRMAAEITAPKECFPAGILVSNVGNMRLLANEMRYFEIRKGMISLKTAINPLMIINYTTYRNSAFVFGYCEPLISEDSISAYIDEYMGIINRLISNVKC
ncbi:hypothetical protein ACJJIU_11085 [Microbulbifer sp. CnH-101-E]|uniref:hypothetical protein n=1 Tax=unclassified Microbulbifer TaxID=2619833 RepID=UPI0040398A1D